MIDIAQLQMLPEERPVTEPFACWPCTPITVELVSNPFCTTSLTNFTIPLRPGDDDHAVAVLFGVN